ncbi:glycosyltransferase [Streptomyces aidingensis]|uniref:Trehalose synthase n=1 Tax=Streptomyces aidingensis TaxID=910347 RepID=A0A1I1QE86_9ACTN|nr:glycosyltransferase [Streptomyces aidingensis]SFD20399.1 trehalose synthase [Streptomyces aidingensis]
MLQGVDVGRQNLDSYRACVGDEVVEGLRTLAAPLRGARVLHVNATPYGGGVAEILRSEVPLLRDLGLSVEWKTISPGEENGFFKITKAIHNALQGDPRGLRDEDWRIYRETSARVAAFLRDDYDVVIVHDPQPLALPLLCGRGDAHWVWRCHIDSSAPNSTVWDRLSPYLAEFDAAVFTLGAFVPPRIPVGRVEIIPPAIDPLSPKNMPIDASLAKGVLDWIGVDTGRPLLVQVSRFDRWKDPLGVIAAYRIVKREIPEVQLALVGSMALDDPEGWEVYREISVSDTDDPDMFLFTNLTGVGNIEVNAFQRHADVVIQKSVREGFGLVVSEALWKGTPVVAGRAGGIPLQLGDGVGGELVDSVEQCADAVLRLLGDPAAARTLAAGGTVLVRERFLLPRLLGDELRLVGDLLGRRPAAPAALAGAASGTAGEPRDPVCGMRITDGSPYRRSHRGRTFFFCSRSCAGQFDADPEPFLRAPAAAAAGGGA